MSDTPTESMLDDRIAELEDENAALRAKVAEQGLSLACLADGIIGEDADDRSDQTLVRVGCRLAGEVAALRADKERLDWIETNARLTRKVGYSRWSFEGPITDNVRESIDIARGKEAQP